MNANRIRTIQLQFEKWRDLLWCKKNNMLMFVCEKKLFGQDSKNWNANLSYFAPSYSPVVGNRFLQSSLICFHLAAGILMDFNPSSFVFSGLLGPEWAVLSIWCMPLHMHVSAHAPLVWCVEKTAHTLSICDFFC